MSTFGERLRELRKERNLLQSDFADMFGISSSAAGSYERNEREPSYSLLVAFSDFFNVSLDYLLCRSEERLTVEDYTSKDTFQLSDMLSEYSIFINSYELKSSDKKHIYDLSRALIFGFDSELS